MNKCLFSVLCAFSIVAFPVARCGAEKLPNIIIVTISGARNSETISEKSHQYIPNLWNRIFKEGVLYTNLKPGEMQFHAPSWASVSSGVEYYKYPFTFTNSSIYTYAAKKYELPKTKLWVIHGFTGFADTTDYISSIDYKFEPSDSGLIKAFDTAQMKRFFEQFEVLYNKIGWPHWDSNSRVMIDIVMKVLDYHKPVVLHYVMAQTETAHTDTFARYVLSIKSSDADFYKIWNYINSDPHYKNNTYLILNVDHPRDDNYMEHNMPRDNVWMFIYGPGIKRDVKIAREIRHVDIFATLAYLLDLETHKTNGSVLLDGFEDNFRTEK